MMLLNSRDRSRLTSRYVYCAKSLETKLIKIGRSWCWRSRITELMMAGGHPILEVCVFEAPSLAERKAHDMAAKSRIIGEWFLDTQETSAAIGWLASSYKQICDWHLFDPTNEES